MSLFSRGVEIAAAKTVQTRSPLQRLTDNVAVRVLKNPLGFTALTGVATAAAVPHVMLAEGAAGGATELAAVGLWRAGNRRAGASAAAIGAGLLAAQFTDVPFVPSA